MDLMKKAGSFIANRLAILEMERLSTTGRSNASSIFSCFLICVIFILMITNEVKEIYSVDNYYQLPRLYQFSFDH